MVDDSMTPEEAMQQFEEIKAEFESLDIISQIKVAAYVLSGIPLSDEQAYEILHLYLAKRCFSLFKKILLGKDDE